VLSPRKGRYASLGEAAAHFWQYEALRHELLELLPLLKTQIIHLHQPVSSHYPLPLQIHATYTREEILAAFSASTTTAPLFLQTGVYYRKPTRTDLLFITLQKTEKDYSPTTRYLDYAISDQIFHWETQVNTAINSERRQNYLHHKKQNRTIMLFIRPTKKNNSSRTTPYFCAGPANYVEHQSERPIRITWRLRYPLPGDIFTKYRAASA